MHTHFHCQVNDGQMGSICICAYPQQNTEHIRAITSCVLCMEYLKEKGTAEMIGVYNVYVTYVFVVSVCNVCGCNSICSCNSVVKMYPFQNI